MITLRYLPFQHKDTISLVRGERSITSAWFKRQLANGEEVNRSRLTIKNHYIYQSKKLLTVSIVYYLHHRLQTPELRLS